MARFRQDNTEGYSDSELAELNAAYEEVLGNNPPNPELGDPEVDKSFEDFVAETVQARFDLGDRGAALTEG